MSLRGGLCAWIIAGLAAIATPLHAEGYSDWAAIVVAGDAHAHSGAPSEVFDNARRDIGTDLARLGFSPANVLEFSTRPERYKDPHLEHADAQTIANALWDLSNRTSGGCLAYFTSHGAPEGIVMDDKSLSPDQMKRIIGNACGDRPTVVVVSACFSGVFVPALEGANRLVFTAARPDRTSFGCGESDKYTFFDTCFLQSLFAVSDFPTLTGTVRRCVAAREQKEKVDYPSEPQVFIGDQVTAELPKWH
jgi:hypothetical protein